MSGFVVTGRGKLMRDPMTVSAADSEFAKFCLMNAGECYVEIWFHAAGKLGRWIEKKLREDDEVVVRAHVCPKAGKLRYLRSSGEYVYLVKAIDFKGTVFVENDPLLR
jgi:hypothetical protein